MKYNIYWGETHDNTHQADDPDFSMARRLEAARSHLDFYCGAYYPSASPAFKRGGHPAEHGGKSPPNTERWKEDSRIHAEWQSVKEAIEKYNNPGRFVTFPGFEWQGDGTWGDHNVFFYETDAPFCKVEKLPELYEHLKGKRALAIPHHTAYITGYRGKDWRCLNEELSPFAEVYSIHGSSEGDLWDDGLRANPFLGPDITANSYSRALSLGKKIGVIASTDNWGDVPGHFGRGLAAVLAKELNRDALWEAFKARRVYGVTGDRIKVDFTLNDAPMGSVSQADATARLAFRVEGCAAMESVEVVKDEEPLRLFPVSPANDDKNQNYKFRLEFGWGPSPSLLELPPKEWEGEVKIDGGDIMEVTPCFTSDANTYERGTKSCRFRGTTTQKASRLFCQNGYVFTMAGSPESRVTITLNGMESVLTLKAMRQESRILWDREASRRFLRENFDLDVEKLTRKDILFGEAYKVKIGRAEPESRYTLAASFTDRLGDDRPHCYRLRVRQRNGQRAWSSPIWING